MNTNTRMYRLKGSELFAFDTTISKAKAKFAQVGLSGKIIWVRHKRIKMPLTELNKGK